ncbi:hypothetical protein I4U23_031573 [Adineta vaga]|nr:hypothetical protein I4U23_031573 [Adineta vaga]
MNCCNSCILFGLFISIHLPLNQTIQNNRCFVIGTYGLFFSIYQICIYGVIIPIIQIVFVVLIAKNLKKVRIRVQPQIRSENESRSVLSKRDMTLIKLVVAEILVGIILTTLYPINVLYSVLTSNIPNKSVDRITNEGFLSFLTLIVLLYLNYCVTFIFILEYRKHFVKKSNDLL